jgi:leucyl-tRNA synthetase
MAPAAPHITEELWHLTGHSGSVHQQSWPAFDPDLANEDITQLPVTVDGKVRDVLSIPVDASEAEAQELAFAQTPVQQFLEGREVAKVIYVPGKILNIVTRKKGVSNDPVPPTI